MAPRKLGRDGSYTTVLWMSIFKINYYSYLHKSDEISSVYTRINYLFVLIYVIQLELSLAELFLSSSLFLDAHTFLYLPILTCVCLPVPVSLSKDDNIVHSLQPLLYWLKQVLDLYWIWLQIELESANICFKLLIQLRSQHFKNNPLNGINRYTVW